MERQLTYAPHGHILTNTGAWSPDGAWIVYDTRSDAAGSVFDGTRIERVNVRTGEVQSLYESRRGAHCGVPICNPADHRVAFILGPEDPTPDWQYGTYHRQGVIVDAVRPGVATNLDARDVTPPFTPGALRGGSHVHVFSPDGAWVSFTYEDHVLATAERGGAELNQRNVAVSMPRPVHVPRTHPRNHDGEFFSAVVTQTVNDPRPGSDEISRAYEDAWLGSGPRRALVFLGDVVGDDGGTFTELFVVELPDDLTRAGERPLGGTLTTRPAPPAGVRQRRLTRTADRRHPGVQGPRHWPRSSSDGARIATILRDDDGTPQLWLVDPASGALGQLTRDPFGVASTFSWNSAGTAIAYIADGSVMTVDAESGRTRRLTPRTDGEDAPRPEACVFSPDDRQVAFVRRVLTGGERFNQVCVVDAI